MKYLLALFTVFAVSNASAQLFPSRCFIPSFSFRNPSGTDSAARYLTQQGMWGNLSHGFHSTGERYGWDISFGGFFELVQWRRSAISLVGDFEILADTYNNISFNPRAIYWTEGLLYSLDFTYDSDTLFPGLNRQLSFGYIHRCRHDVDNLDYNTVGAHESRSLIYGSLMGRLVGSNFPIIPGIKATVTLQIDQYIIRQDDRIPASTTLLYDINTLNTSIAAGMKIDIYHWGDALLYMRYMGVQSAYNAYKDWASQFRAEAGLEFSGAATRMSVFIGDESFIKDDLNRPTPVPSDFFYVGFRFIGKNVGL